MDGYLSVRGVSKSFPGVRALDAVSMEIRRGEVHAICGENGAGKSTLMNILSGNDRMDSGELWLDGEPCRFQSPYEAQCRGVSIVHQERSLVDSLTVAENIFVNCQPLRLGMIDKGEMRRRTRGILDRLGQSDILPGDLVGSLPPARQQMIELCKALNHRPRVLILDEPTATITEKEVRVLFDTIRRLREEGVTVLYISHRMAEIFEICDRVTVLRDGKYQATREVAETSMDEVVSLMVGRVLSQERASSHCGEQEVLRVEKLSGGRFREVSFTLHRGEILGFAGLAGAGRTEMARAIFGADPKTGRVYLHGREVQITHPDKAIRHGIGYLPEDRKLDGLFLDMSIEENIISGNLRHMAPKRLVRRSLMTRAAQQAREQLRIMAPSVKRRVVDLSGGNQQKVVIAKWLLADPEILIVDEPTRGIDVGAKDEIYRLMHQMVAAGKSILMISSDLPEVLRMSDRIIVMHNGAVTGRLDNRDGTVSEEAIMHCASGL